MSIKIDEVRSIEHLSPNDLIREIKNKKSTALVGIIDCVIEKADKKDVRLWAVASRAFAELHLRKYSKSHGSELAKLKEKIEKKSGTTMPSHEYAPEVAGVENKGKILRPYPRSDAAKKIVEKWQKSKTSKSFDSYIASHHDIKKLSEKKVHFLSRDERPKYEVTFKDNKVLINGKKPHDGAYIFALDSKGEMLLAGKKEKGVFHHTSFFAGKPVQSAGVLDIKKQHLTRVRLSSGHYRPTMEKDGKNLQAFLKSSSRLGKEGVEALRIASHK